jgi:hypothetical protein
MAFDPTKPIENTPLDAAEMRDQLNALKDLIDALPASAEMTARLNADTAGNCEFVSLPSLTISNPPTQAEVQNLANVISNLYVALTRT